MTVKKRFTVSMKSVHRSKVLTEYQEGRLSRAEVALVLDLSERQVSRLIRRFNSGGLVSIEHNSAGRQSTRTTPLELAHRIKNLIQNKYKNFNYKHFHEYLVEFEGIRLSYSTVKRICSSLGATKRPRRRHKVRKHRMRYPCVGMMIQMDGSDHAWVPKKKLGTDRPH